MRAAASVGEDAEADEEGVVDESGEAIDDAAEVLRVSGAGAGVVDAEGGHIVMRDVCGEGGRVTEG